MLLCGYFPILRARSVETLQDVIRSVNDHYYNGNFQKAESEFRKHSQRFSKNQLFQQEYLNLLLKTGQYNKILDMEGEVTEGMKKVVEKARECEGILRTKNPHRIAELLNVSPNSIEVRKMALKSSLMKKNFVDFRVHQLKLANMLITDQDKSFLSEMQGVFEAYHGKYEMAIKKFEDAKKMYAAEKLKSFYVQFRNIKTMPQTHKDRADSYKKLARSVSLQMVLDEYQPSIYEKLLNDIRLECLRVVSIGSLKGYTDIAYKLYSHNKSKEALSLIIQAYIYDEKFAEGKELLEKHKLELGPHTTNLLSNLMKETQKKIKEREEETKRTYEENNRRQQNRRQYTPPVVPSMHQHDYYKILGVKKSAKTPEIKKSYRKKMREISRKPAETPEQKKKIESEKQLLNKAYDVLVDEKKRREYDTGEQEVPYNSNQYRQYQQGNNYYYTYSTGGNHSGDDFERIFESFFGDGSRNGGYYYTRYF